MSKRAKGSTHILRSEAACTDLSRVARTPRAGLGHAHVPVVPSRVAAHACGLAATPHGACGLRGRFGFGR